MLEYARLDELQSALAVIKRKLASYDVPAATAREADRSRTKRTGRG
jgi:hypothetical protein